MGYPWPERDAELARCQRERRLTDVCLPSVDRLHNLNLLICGRNGASYLATHSDEQILKEVDEVRTTTRRLRRNERLALKMSWAGNARERKEVDNPWA